MGGDEFAILLPQSDSTDALNAAERVLDAVRTFRIAVSEKPVGVTASLGIAMLPEHGATAEEALAHADLAMYRAKTLRDRFCMFSPEKDSEQVFTLQREWEERLRAALEGDVFSFCAQPIVSLKHDEIRYELLLRAKGDDGNLVLPGEFLPIAERTGLIYEIDRWVIRGAIQLLAEQQRAGRDVVFEVNLSARAFDDDELPSLIESELKAAGARPEGLVLEITETATMSDVKRANRFIWALKKVGCRFAIDDFGVGFSSFYYLKHLSVDYLKIDGSFVRNLARDAVDQHLVRAIVEVARGLGIETIAEFVGDAETVEIIREMGVDYGQGFYLGVPRPVSEGLSLPGRSFERAA